MTNDNEERSGPRTALAEILRRQAVERADLKKRHDKLRSTFPKKDRVGRQRFLEDAFEEEKQLVSAHESERAMHGISDEDVIREMSALSLSSSTSTETPNSGNTQEGGRSESKAARRRRKKAEQEAEAQRRIDEEKAAMGPSAKTVELNAINQQLKPMQLYIHPVPADGHCLYSAVAHQMQLAQISADVCPSVEGLRNAAADYLSVHKAKFAPFIETVGNDDEKFNQYCEGLRNTAVWGGQVELEVLAKVLNVIIEVYAADLPVVRMGADDVTECQIPVLRLSFHRQYLGLGEHYNSVAPRVQ